jgi:hypothetical protein
MSMPNETEENSEDSTCECAVCYVEHDVEIHEATLRIHRWLHGLVTRNFKDSAVPTPELQAGLVAA